ncbi:hypothetical protein KSX31_01015, partial [Bacteroides stercoris]|nr:hypothetical protein [Bacteroides stercoris]
MKILILEDEQRNAKRLIRLLNDIDRTFIVEGPLASIKETVEFFLKSASNLNGNLNCSKELE